MKTKLTIFAIGAFFILALGSVRAYEALQGPTELRYWNKEKACNGYTLFGAHGTAYLIDMEGQVVNTWRVGTNPRFLDNGNLLDATRDDPSGFQGFVEMDWSGNVVWEYQEKREDYAPHHDWERIFNKKLNAYTTLYIANKTITREQAIAAGCDPSKLKSDGRDQGDQRRDEDRKGPPRDGGKGGPRGGRGDRMQVDAVVEVDMNGKVVWEWWFFDHVIQDVDPEKPNHVGNGKTIADYPNRLNLNLPGRPLKGDWLHCNSLDYNAELDQIVVNSVQGEFYVIDHGNTFVPGDPKKSMALAAGPAGDFLYRFGDPARYGQGDPPSIMEDWTKSTTGHKQIGGSHDVHWIAPGLSGAGHFLVFNNGQYLFERTPQSYIFEIDGFRDARGNSAGKYVNPPDAGYYELESPHDTHKTTKRISNQVVWIYSSKSNQSFFSHIGSGCQRLPNGNTLICAGTEGHLFEITREGELVWEYINPVTKEYGTVKVLPDSLPMTNAVFNAFRYGPDHPALKGKDLTPKGTITEKFARGPDRRSGDRGEREDDQGKRPPRRDSEREPDRGGPPQGKRQEPGENKPPAAQSLTAPGAAVVELGDGFEFTEGPAADAEGNVFFSDLSTSRIYKWSVDGKLSTFRTNSGGANGLFFDKDGNLLACEGDNRCLVSIDAQGNTTVLADQYNGKPFNKPNDLWIDPKGGVYFSDPAYGTEAVQDGEHAYYLTPDRKKTIRVIGDMVRPNGIIGTPDGKTLYVTDWGAKKTYKYDVNNDGTLSNKKPFAPIGSDGMTIDNKGNIYLTDQAVLVYDSTGKQIEEIGIPKQPTNVCFGGRDQQTLFITARTSIYSIQMRVRGVSLLPRTLPAGQFKDDGKKAGAPPEGPGAREDQTPDQRPDRGPGRPQHPLNLALDADGDGEISAEEIQNAEAALKKLDKDGDGRLSREELRPERDDRGDRRDREGEGGRGGADRQGRGGEQVGAPDQTEKRSSSSAPVSSPRSGGPFALRSPEVDDGGTLPKEYTGDGASATLPLEWSGAPDGTRSYAVIMHHVAPDGEKWYWILYNIPPSVQRLPKNVTGVGTLGNNSINGRTEYAPPHSKGPGAKTYIYTVYALSAPPRLSVPPSQVSRDVLLAAIKDLILASAELQVTYTRFNR